MVKVFLEQFKPMDVLAIFLLISFVFLATKGNESTLLPSLTLVLGFYFGKEHERAVNSPPNV